MHAIFCNALNPLPTAPEDGIMTRPARRDLRTLLCVRPSAANPVRFTAVGVAVSVVCR